MSLSIINRNSTANITITMPGGSPLTYKAQFNRFDVRAFAGKTDTTTFASETNGSSEQNAINYIVTYGGISKTGVDGSNGAAVNGDLLALPQDVASTWQFATGASIAGTWDYDDHTVSRIAGGVSTFAGIATSDGTVTIAWPET